MSTAEKSRGLPYDATLAAQEVERRERLANDTAYQTGVAAAKATALANAIEAVRAKLADLKRHTVTRDETVPGRQRYDRTYNALKDAAIRLDSITGQGVAIPAWLPPPDAAAEAMVIVRAPAPVVDTGGQMKDRGQPLTSLPVFGSLLDTQLREAGVLK